MLDASDVLTSTLAAAGLLALNILLISQTRQPGFRALSRINCALIVAAPVVELLLINNQRGTRYLLAAIFFVLVLTTPILTVILIMNVVRTILGKKN